MIFVWSIGGAINLNAAIIKLLLAQINLQHVALISLHIVFIKAWKIVFLHVIWQEITKKYIYTKKKVFLFRLQSKKYLLYSFESSYMAICNTRDKELLFRSLTNTL